MRYILCCLMLSYAIGCSSVYKPVVRSAEHVGAVSALIESAKGSLDKASKSSTPKMYIEDAKADLALVSNTYIPLLHKDAEQQGKAVAELAREREHWVGYPARQLGWKLFIVAAIFVVIIVVARALSLSLGGVGGTVASGTFHLATGGLVLLFGYTVRLARWVGGLIGKVLVTHAVKKTGREDKEEAGTPYSQAGQAAGGGQAKEEAQASSESWTPSPEVRLAKDIPVVNSPLGN